MKIKKVNSYTRHGRNYNGRLGVIEHKSEWMSTNDPYSFGSMSCFDALDKAKEMMEAEYPGAEILLGIPDLVFRIPAKRMAAIGTNAGMVSEEEVESIYQAARAAIQYPLSALEMQNERAAECAVMDDYYNSLPAESGR